MLEEGLIFPVDQAEWINPIVIKNKKDAIEIKVCVNYRILNNSCVIDPFLTPFSDEVLGNVAWNESYSLTNGFLGYH